MNELTTFSRVRRLVGVFVLAVLSVAAGSAMADPVATQSCANDGCQTLMTIEYCADGYDGTYCDMQGSSCICKRCSDNERCGSPLPD